MISQQIRIVSCVLFIVMGWAKVLYRQVNYRSYNGLESFSRLMSESGNAIGVGVVVFGVMFLINELKIDLKYKIVLSILTGVIAYFSFI